MDLGRLPYVTRRSPTHSPRSHKNPYFLHVITPSLLDLPCTVVVAVRAVAAPVTSSIIAMAAVDGSLPSLRRWSHSPPRSPDTRERPLPPIPAFHEQLPSSLNYSVPIPKPSAVALGKRKAAVAPILQPSEAIRRMLESPHILSCFLEAMPWSSFDALISTCRDFRQIFTVPELRDVILSRFIPGYRLCLGNRDVAELAVDINIQDLALFREFRILLHGNPPFSHYLFLQRGPRRFLYTSTQCTAWQF